MSWYGARGPWSGKARVSIDGRSLGTVDTHATSSTGRATIWSSPRLSSGRHTVQITVLGTRRSGGTGTAVSVDSLTVR